MTNRRIAVITDTPGGNYLVMLRSVLPYIARLRLGNRVEIRHDDWCGIFKGAPCNCAPEIEVALLDTPSQDDG